MIKRLASLAAAALMVGAAAFGTGGSSASAGSGTSWEFQKTWHQAGGTSWELNGAGTSWE